MGVNSFLINSAFNSPGFAGSRPAASHFSLLRQRKVTKRKATRSLSPYALLRARCGARSKWGQSQTRLSPQTSACPDPLCPALLASARSGVGSGCGVSPHPNPLPEGEGTNTRPALRIPHYPLSLRDRAGVRASPNLYLNPLPQPVLAGLEIFIRDGLKILDVRRQRSWLVSKISVSTEYFKEPRSGPDCGSPFLLLTLLLAKQKKSELPPGNPRHSPQGRANQPKCNLRNK